MSVCIPTVNRPEMLREAIASVAAQSWSDFEVLLADNSGDPSIQSQIDQVMSAFPDVPFVLKRHPTRLDAIDNFNSLVEGARGDLWACLTDDDRFCPDFLARSVEALDRHPECAFTFADHWVIDERGVVDVPSSDRSSERFGRTALREGVYDHEVLFDVALKQSMCLQTAVFRRDVIAAARFLPGIMSGDLSLFLRLAADPKEFSAYYIDSRLFEYRIHESQLSFTTDRKVLLRSQIAALESAGRVPARHRPAYNRKLGESYVALALLEAESGARHHAREHARTGLRLDTSVRNGLAALLVTAAPFAVRDLRRLKEFVRTAP